MSVPFLDLRPQHERLREELQAAIERVMESQQFILGSAVEQFERAAAARLGTPHAVGVASGTDALLLALKALELPAGSEVIVPSFTFFATAGAVWNAGLKPVFADVDADTFNMTAETVRAVLSPRTRAVVVVHLYGQMAPMEDILQVTGGLGLPVIEDVAQSFGARRRMAGEWHEAGTVTEFGAFSFFPTKVLGGFGDGGMITSADETLADRVRKLRVHGGHKMYHHEVVGTNSRLDALQAAMLTVKLGSVNEAIEGRRRVATAYDRALEGIDGVRPPVVASGNEHVFNVYTIRVAEREGLRAHLGAAGIGSNVYYPLPLHLQPCFASLGGGTGDLPVTERLADEVLSLPIFPDMRQDQVEEVASEVRSFFGG